MRIVQIRDTKIQLKLSHKKGKCQKVGYRYA